MSGADCRHTGRVSRWLVYAVLLGLYLTFRGYHSLDGDQAYRLPLLLHRQHPKLYAGDPFVRAFDAFNPHKGCLLVLDVVTRPLGISSGLFLLFTLTFALTCFAVDRLARGIWPNLGPSVGVVAAGLVLSAKAGNIGTNHIFEAMVLDRQIAFALGWFALSQLIVQPDRGRPLVLAAIALATLVHPSAGLQLALALVASLAAWSLLSRLTEVHWRGAIVWILGLVFAVIPGLAYNVQAGSQLMGQMPASDFWLLSVELQSPQHMLPHLWRMPQWLACLSYLAMAALAVSARRTACPVAPVPTGREPSGAFGPSAARVRLVAALVVILAGLAAAWFLIEKQHSLQVTVFQPFRMATIARGIALALIAGRIAALWKAGAWLPRMRAILLAVSVTGDWLMVMVTLAELAVSSAEALRAKLTAQPVWKTVDAIAFLIVLCLALNFLGHHDTEYGHLPLLAAIGVGVAVAFAKFRRSPEAPARVSWTWTPIRRLAFFALAWAAPAAALLASAVPLDHPLARSGLVHGLISRCRFAAVPNDDIERLALWCRAHTPESASFIGPPGPKTFRLWSQRGLAFNRAASPYHAAGLADWFARFRDHVGFRGDVTAFVHDYLADRHGFEERYDRLSDTERAALAQRQGAAYVVALAPARSQSRGAAQKPESPLELLHVEGRYAVYRVRSELLVHRQR
jgi:Domain of unknown function (DUF6798)